MTTLLLMTSFAALMIALIAVAARSASPLASRREPLSTVEYAERIVARRYAHGQITAQQYERTLAVLRR